jgi:hypothetical protein
MPAVLKRISQEIAGIGETFRIAPRKKLNKGGCECK